MKKRFLERFKKVRNSLSRAHVGVFLKGTLVTILITLTSFGIVGTQLFYPFHILIGLGVYIFSFVPLVRKIYQTRKKWMRHRAYTFTKTFIIAEGRALLIVTGVGIVIMGYLLVRPYGNSPFADVSTFDIQRTVADDMYMSVTLMDYLESTGNELLQTLSVSEENANVTKQISEQFIYFLDAVMATEELTDRHRYFADISRALPEERSASFMMSYALYVKKYELVHRIFAEVSGNEYQKKVLNQTVPQFNRGDVFNEMVARFYTPKTRLRINLGKVYMQYLVPDKSARYGDPYILLMGKADASYGYLLKNFNNTLLRAPEVALDATTGNMFDVWFPIQRAVANSMGHAILSDRGKEYFITDEQITHMKRQMQPGDIMLQRRNWHVSNVGIPGFWTHSALYTGTLADMDVFFADIFPYEGFDSFSSYVREKNPRVYEQYLQIDTDGEERSVIEAIEPGIVLQSLTLSAHADFVAVVRPNLPKEKVFQALVRAYEHFGKPYDYNFDFDTRDALVCSELVYDSYFSDEEGAGLSFETSLVNGRKMVTPLDIAKKFREEHEGRPELSFVYFIRGSERDNRAYVSDEQTFLESVEWNKFSFLQDS